MTDYRNTDEGRIVSQKYADILPLSRPEPIRPRMSTQNRAKIFSPFAALRGYEDEIADQNRVQELTTRTELSDELQEHISQKLHRLRKGMTVTISFFEDDICHAPLGTYKTLTGTLTQIDPVKQILEIGSHSCTDLHKSQPIRIAFEQVSAIRLQKSSKNAILTP